MFLKFIVNLPGRIRFAAPGKADFPSLGLAEKLKSRRLPASAKKLKNNRAETTKKLRDSVVLQSKLFFNQVGMPMCMLDMQHDFHADRLLAQISPD